MPKIILLFVSLMPLSLTSQTPFSFPQKKNYYPERYYDAFLKEHEKVESIIMNPDAHWYVKKNQYWNRFLWHFKAGTDKPADIVNVFEDSYRLASHEFCEDYLDIVPSLIKNNEYLPQYYEDELPIMNKRCTALMESYDQDLLQKIKEIEESDQEIRLKLKDKSEDELTQSELWKKQLEIDKKNLKEIENIIEDIGYPGRKQVGVKYEIVAFLVIQHSGLEVIEKYLPIIERAIAAENLKPTVYPYIFDRKQILKGAPQYFGTQSKLGKDGELFEIFDKENVNIRRSKYALPPL